MIKLKNIDKESALRKMYLTIDTDNTATGSNFCTVVVPVKCELERICFSSEKDVSACAGNALHVVVGATNVAGLSSIALIDYTVTGACAGALSANAIINYTATQLFSIPAFSNLTVNISGSSVIGPLHGVLVFRIDRRDEK